MRSNQDYLIFNISYKQQVPFKVTG